MRSHQAGIPRSSAPINSNADRHAIADLRSTSLIAIVQVPLPIQPLIVVRRRKRESLRLEVLTKRATTVEAQHSPPLGHVRPTTPPARRKQEEPVTSTLRIDLLRAPFALHHPRRIRNQHVKALTPTGPTELYDLALGGATCRRAPEPELVAASTWPVPRPALVPLPVRFALRSLGRSHLDRRRPRAGNLSGRRRAGHSQHLGQIRTVHYTRRPEDTPNPAILVARAKRLDQLVDQPATVRPELLAQRVQHDQSGRMDGNGSPQPPSVSHRNIVHLTPFSQAIIAATCK